MADTDTSTDAAPTTPAPSAAPAAAPATQPVATPQETVAATPPTKSWRDLKGLEKFKDDLAMGQAYLELEKVHRASVKIPGKDAKPEEIAAYREKVGVPKSPSDYTLKVPDPKTGQAIDAKRWEAAVPFFHKAGFSQDQVQALAEWAVTEEAARKAAAEQANLDAVNQLADKWGQQTFDRRAQLAKRGVEAVAARSGVADLQAHIDQLGIGNDPKLFQAFAYIGEQFAHARIIDGNVEGVSSPDQLKDEIAEIRKELTTIRDDTPRARELTAKLEQKYKALYPEGTAVAGRF